MSQENVEIVRRAFEYEISGRGDAAEVLACGDFLTPPGSGVGSRPH